MSKPVGTRMDDDEFARHQNSPEWAARERSGQKWLNTAQRKINTRYDVAVQTAQRRYYAALAKAAEKRDTALNEVREIACERQNQDIREIAVTLGIWK